jgi:hypothetical protein
MTMRRFARAEVGMTLIETLVTVVVLTGGLLTTLSVFSSMGSATYKAQRKVVLVSLAQREMERLRVLPYDKIGLSGPVHASAATKAPLPANVMAGGLVGGGVVDPGPTRFGPDEPGSLRIESVSGVIYRYVTWRSQPCPAVNTSVATQLSTELGQAQSTVAAAVGDLCPGSHQTKRITIVVVSSDIVKHGGPARLSTVVVDPASSVLAAGGYDGLQVNAQPVVNQATGGSPATPSSVYANVTSQALHLTDTPCTQSTRAEPDSAGHSSHDTSRAVAVGTDRCSTGSVAADLMTLTPPTGLLTAPLPDLSNEVSRPAVGGLALVRDDRVGTCADTGYAQS